MYFGSNVKQCVGISMEQMNIHVTNTLIVARVIFALYSLKFRAKMIFSHYANINIGFETNRQTAN